MQQIKLTTDPNTIHVDQVDVSKGVYGLPNDDGKIQDLSPFFLQKESGGWVNACSVTAIFASKRYSTLRQVIQEAGLHDFYTLSGQRITLEKELTIADLKDSDHVGFVDKSGNKGFVAHAGEKRFLLMDCGVTRFGRCNEMWGDGGNTLIQALKGAETCAASAQIVEILLFTTRHGSETSLFGWLNSPGK